MDLARRGIPDCSMSALGALRSIQGSLGEHGPTLIENQLIREEVPIILPKTYVIVSMRKLPQIPRDGTTFIRALLSMASL